jgi:hypothetical protein
VFDDPDSHLAITNTLTRETYNVGILTPLLSLKWTGDSRAIVTIEHIAGGSEANVLSFAEGRWNRFTAEPGIDAASSGHYEVIQQTIGWDKASFTYKVTEKQSNGLVLGFYTCSFEVDTRTKAISSLVKTRIDRSTYDALHYH